MATLIVVQDILWSVERSRSGHCFYVFQLLKGLEQLGHKVFYLNQIGFDPREKASAPLKRYQRLMKQWWHPDQAALVRRDSAESICGVSTAEIKHIASEAAALITTGAQYSPLPHSLVRGVRPRILIDGDPGYTHLWAAEWGAANIFGEQDFYFSHGVNIGTPLCSLPTFGLTWRPCLTPIVLEWWAEETRVVRDRFTTISGWLDQGEFSFEGKKLGPKADEFQKFINLPRMVGEEIEIALEMHPAYPKSSYSSVADFKRRGWKIADPFKIVRTMKSYRDYIKGSTGEFTCVKGGYFGTNCGIFVERSACYLAAGRPVVTQSTGFERLIPSGRGLFAVQSVEEAAEAVKAIRMDYHVHSNAAREIAQEYFDSQKVIAKMLEDVGI